MFAEKLDRVSHRAAVEAGYAPLSEYVEAYRSPLAGPFPNLRARETIKALVEGIVETINHVPMSENVQLAFALGYVRGAITVLRQECEELDVPYSALPFALDILDKFSQKGIAAVREIAEHISGQELREADARVAHDQLARDMLPDLDLVRRPRDPLTARCDGVTCVHCGSPHHSEHPRELPAAAE